MNDGPLVDDLVAGQPNVRLIHLNAHLSTGAKRNFCCEHARGEIIAHFDDDDWSHPERLAEQVRLLQSGARVAGYFAVPFDGPNGETWLYRSEDRHAIGTSLTYWWAWWSSNKFKPHQVGEDVDFVARAMHVLKSEDGSNRMVATTHAQNTSPRTYRDRSGKPRRAWTQITRTALPKEYLEQL